MDAATYNSELEVPLSSSLSVDQRLERLSAMVNVSTVVSKWLVVDNNFSASLTDVHFSLATLSLAVSEVSIGHLCVNFFDLVQRIFGFLQGEELELHLRADGAISDVVLVDSFPVLVEDAEVIKVCMSVEIHWHFVEREFHGG